MSYKVEPKLAKNIYTINWDDSLLNDADFIQEMRQRLIDCDGYIIKNFISQKVINNIIEYLSNIGKSSFPSWHPLLDGCPDFHRVHMSDPRSYVKGVMHQFVFHPWNQNIFDLFAIMKDLYILKNLTSGIEPESFLKTTPKDGHVSRLSFHLYPTGGGMLKKHADPIGKHQLSVPILQMSQKGRDYITGGVYVEGSQGLIYPDDNMNPGDVLFFNAEVIHGVSPIDPDKELDWLSFKGRWMMIASVIKSQNNEDAANSLALEE